ncbi:MAG: beta-glucuronidase [Parabacteroides sp.]|nr:beta-glucuronidase [Parabacteroides sp.]
MKNKLKKVFAFVLFCSVLPVEAQTREIDLSGVWRFQTDVMDFRRGSLSPRYNHLLPDSIVLPGITDDYRIGYKVPYIYPDRLTRKYEYMGPAWYQRDIKIPETWKGKRIFLYFERTHWLSSVYVDTKEASRIDYISVPHSHDLTGFVTPGGMHRITVCIDNRFRYDTHKWNHAHSEFTQINWNGILGEIKLFALDPVYIDDLQLYPDITRRAVKIKMAVKNYTGKPVSGNALFTVAGKEYRSQKSIAVNGNDSVVFVEDVMPLGSRVRCWDEFNPDIYTLTCRLDTRAGETVCRHEKSADFGMREVKQGKNHIWLNNHPVHLRGTVENAVFPKTGYAPVCDAEWERIMLLMKTYGLNHMRFHSWCPPRAAFRMADKHGIYLEVEMPMWGKDAEPDEARYDFFRREIKAILKEYGNHPSFVLYCNGNEITGDFDFIEELTAAGRTLDSRHLYSGSTARKRVRSDQYFISQQTRKGPVKVYEGLPSTCWDRNKESNEDVPVISHEAGQRCMYPDFGEIGKYAGSLVEPRNLEAYRDMLAQNGMAGQAHDFFRASGALTVIEYKAVIEALLRTSASAGFQLLSLNDFPGQGYAPVSILDSFWDSKGLVTPGKFREFCAPEVALLRYGKSAYFQDETFTGQAEMYRFGASVLKNAKIKWRVADDSGKTVRKGNLKTGTIGNYGVFPVGGFSFDLKGIPAPQKLTVHLSVDNRIMNSWNIWVYPRNETLPVSTGEVLYTPVYDEKARQQLEAGKTVVLFLSPGKVKGRKSVFPNHFWNPVMFAWPPMTLGCLIHEEEPVFADFVTSYHTDWQWWDILNHAKVIEMQDGPRALRPFIQVIDAFDSNRKLGIGFEARVNGGKLLVLAVDTEKNMNDRPATKQLLKSIDRYVKSDRFHPQTEADESFIRSFLKN